MEETGATALMPPGGGAVEETALPRKPAPTSGPGEGRLLSLDVFRGATIAGMLLVNNPGNWSAIYAPLRHAEWNGWTPTDLIFPFFLFIAGVAMTFSFGKLREGGVPRNALLKKVAKRSAILFGLGLLLHAFPNYLDLSHLRIPGVLQRIALAYFAASAIVLYLGVRAQIAATAFLLLAYWALQTLVPVPGFGPGVLEAGKDLGAYIDRLVFGENHLWIWSKTWDPEGLLSTLPAVSTVLAGVFTGYWLRSPRPALSKMAGLFIAGSVGLLLGLAWNAWFPINKNLWTSSYVVFTAGMACLFLAVCYWLVDMRGYRRWATPFLVYGMNAILAFFFSSLMARSITLIMVPSGDTDVALKTFVYERAFAPYASPMNASLAFAIAYVLLWLGILWVLYRRNIFLKV
jgi:predicted acyltransferase